MRNKIVLIIIAIFSLNNVTFADTATENKWIKAHHGIIFYQDYRNDRYDLNELTRMAEELGTNAVKTWIKGHTQGEIPEKAENDEYEAIFESFEVICLNVCPDYILGRWDVRKKYDEETREDIEADFYQLTESLIDDYDGYGKTFIINYFFEMNVYMGTPSSGRPNFPVIEFIADAQSGVKKALREIKTKDIKIFDCIESNCDHDYFDFVKNIFPKVNVDLYSISYYGYKSLNMLKHWAKYAPDNKLFGDKNIIVGEYGIKMEDPRVNGDKNAQSAYLKSIRKQAKELKVPYIFLFWLADQESKIKSEGHFGIVNLEGERRKAWSDLYNAYHFRKK